MSQKEVVSKQLLRWGEKQGSFFLCMAVCLIGWLLHSYSDAFTKVSASPSSQLKSKCHGMGPMEISPFVFQSMAESSTRTELSKVATN